MSDPQGFFLAMPLTGGLVNPLLFTASSLALAGVGFVVSGGGVKLALSEGLTGWVAREKRLLSISREAYHDPRFKFFTDLLEDTYEAFLSAPVISRRGVEGVINVQHRNPHAHSGMEMELLTTVGEQIGCLVALAQSDLKALDTAQVLDLVMSPARRG